jgi:hypothetical protein
MSESLPPRPKDGGHQPDCPVCENRMQMGMIACLAHRTPDERAWRVKVAAFAREA